MTNEINRMTKEFLNEEMKPYSELTREEKHILLDAVIDNRCEAYDELQGVWFEKNVVAFGRSSIYRTKPKEYKKLDIPWQFIKPEFKYATLDCDGDIWVYTSLPVFHDAWWIKQFGVCAILGVLEIDRTGVIPEHSLTERPDGV